MAGTVIADNLQAASTSQLVIKNGVASTPPTIQDSAGTTIGTFCRAWVNFNGTGTVAIRGSGNVTSITDNGVGDYRVNFTTAMPDVNYSNVFGDVSGSSQVHLMPYISSASYSTYKTTTSLRFTTYNNTTAEDTIELNLAVFR